MNDLTIGLLAKAGGVGVETVRFYQRRGLLAEPQRPSENGVRRYGVDYVRRLRFIRRAQRAGFKLIEIRELLALDATQDRDRIQTLATCRIEALDQEIAELRAARQALASLAVACKAGSPGACPILTAFDVQTP
ncbi:MerR family transcriptional regulator [Porphyrobacter sp. GA68]|uniref:MerR family transcriptional regulator n=1 Tax=Porphyrobacter sp. GA68 TaxID=2883480 RepID=UPI001D19459D|nr:MerR family transcriptional regulator [Porphyrobacter sp. GA68]